MMMRFANRRRLSAISDDPRIGAVDSQISQVLMFAVNRHSYF